MKMASARCSALSPMLTEPSPASSRLEIRQQNCSTGLHKNPTKGSRRMSMRGSVKHSAPLVSWKSNTEGSAEGGAPPENPY